MLSYHKDGQDASAVGQDAIGVVEVPGEGSKFAEAEMATHEFCQYVSLMQ